MLTASVWLNFMKSWLGGGKLETNNGNSFGNLHASRKLKVIFLGALQRVRCVLDAEIELSKNIPICPSNVLHILQLTSQNCVTLCHLYLPILMIVLLHIPRSIFPQLCSVPNSPMYPQFCLAPNSPIYPQFCPIPNSPICHQFCPVPK